MKLFMKRELKEIKNRLEEYLKRIYREIKGLTSEMVDYLDKSSGKRYRSMLLYISGKFLGADEEPLIKLGASIELIHLGSLLHDDIIDEATVRRGLTSAHKLFGVEEAIILGDLLNTKAILIVASFGDLRIIESVATEVEAMIAGEMEEELNSFRYDIKEEEYYKIIEGKTARLISLSCYLPAIYLRSQDYVEPLKEMGLNLGMAFQILDDIVDVIMDREKLGKPVLSDLKEGKMTLPYIYYRDSGGRYSSDIKEFFENKKQPDFYAIKDDLIKSSSIERAFRKMEEYIKKARKVLLSLPESNKWKEILYESTNIRGIYGV